MAEYARVSFQKVIEFEWRDDQTVFDDGVNKFASETSIDVLRVLAKSLAEDELYAPEALERTEIDSWLTFSLGQLNSKCDIAGAAQHLNKILASLTYLIGKRATIADFAVFSALYGEFLFQYGIIQLYFYLQVL